jgi:atypical dual specificity phosphatase
MLPRTRILFIALPVAFAAALWLPHLLQPAEPPLDYTRIEPGLYIGSHTAAPPPAAAATLNLCENDDPYRTPVYRWSPIPDAAPAPSLDWLNTQVDFITRQRAAGHAVYVHCNAGKSRSALVLAAYLMQQRHLSKIDALALLQSRRPIVHPIAPFMDLLDQYQATLR